MAFPNVPDVPGVPALVRDVLASVPDVVQLLVADALSLFAGLEPPQWGLFLGGEPAVIAESVVSFEYKQRYEVASFPIEQGGFESYDKVQRPFDVRLRFSTGGSAADRDALLASARAAVASLDLFDAVTPLATYESVNPVHIDYRQTATQGVGLLVLDLFCEQVRITASSSFTNSLTAGGNGSAAASASSSSPGAGGGGGAAGGGVGGVAPTGTITITPTSTFFNPKSPSASPQVSDGTVQAVPAAPGQFDLSQALP